MKGLHGFQRILLLFLLILSLNSFQELRSEAQSLHPDEGNPSILLYIMKKFPLLSLPSLDHIVHQHYGFSQFLRWDNFRFRFENIEIQRLRFFSFFHEMLKSEKQYMFSAANLGKISRIFFRSGSCLYGHSMFLNRFEPVP